MLNDIDDLHEDGVDFISLKENIDLTTAQESSFSTSSAHLTSSGPTSRESARTRWSNVAERKASRSVARRNSNQVYEWREKGLSYGEIATLAGEIFDTDVTRQTIYRYC
ncbi:hypothetical protein C484_18107 [Natrialba taiwanensis DSM 12281]|uniref:Uncharacterized protein n=1 Tax=Natrialba taiwanensis DSM 12281 TaxID=1230458 RepID=L9ZMY8_9EURY|nr:hypothetical protein C484_18107 [Natrialba taiwanensis DSM 12281]